ncbi:MAG: GGDEF domain-containing protein [Pyrinomonadaceae bacterium]
MNYKLDLMIQLTSVVLITVLAVFLQRSIRSLALRYWTYAWLSLSFALICLRFAFNDGAHSDSLYTLYFLGEYIFGLALIAGCRNLTNEIGHQRISELYLIPAVLTAIGLPLYSRSFDDIYSVHCLIMSGFFAGAVVALRKASLRSFGWRVMHVSLGLLSLDLLVFFIIFATGRSADAPILLQYNSVIHLVLEATLGLGMIIVLLEKVLADTRTANEELEVAHNRLEELVNTDPLTAAFNRHAFYGFVNRDDAGTISGCVGFFDLDDLKGINDAHGHAAGDQAIRAAARAIREVIRAEDLIYRWGGDEFFVIMIGMEADLAKRRMASLERRLCGLRLEGLDDPLDVGVSIGFANFKGSDELEASIKRADAEMYRNKKARKDSRGMPGDFMPPVRTGQPPLPAS